MRLLLRSVVHRELLVMGGDSAKDQIRALQGGVDIVCGTPGRLDDLIGTGKLDLSGVMALTIMRRSCDGHVTLT